MDDLKAASLALAREALVPPKQFDPSSRALTARLEKMLSVLKSVEPRLITANVAEYVYFPLHSLLQQSQLGARPTELLLRILSILVATAWRSEAVFDLPKAQQLTAVTTYLLSPEPPTLTGNSAMGPSKHFLESPSSLHAAGFECLNAIFQSAAHCRFGPALGQAPTMAHVIAILLAGLQYDTADLDSQKQSIIALTTVLHDIVVNPDHRGLVLPRIASKLAKFIAHTNRKHYSAKILAISCLRELLVGCLSDASFDLTAPSPIRTAQWLEKTGEPISHTLQILRNLLVAVESRQSGRPELIESLYDFASTVYVECRETLSKASAASVDTLMDMLLLSSSQNLSTSVRDRAEALIRGSNLAPNQLKTSMSKQIQSLATVLDSPNEDRALQTLRSLQKSVIFVNSADAYDAVLDGLMDALPLSVVKAPKLAALAGQQVQALDTFDPRQNAMIRLSDLGLTLPLSDATQELVHGIISEIGKKVNAGEIVARLCNSLELLRARGRGSLDGTLTLWSVASIIRSMPSESDLYDVVEYCFSDIQSAMDIQSQSAKDLSPAVFAHTAMCCYVIGEVALNQGQPFEESLVDLVHPMFSMLGDSGSPYIRQQAQLAISKIAFACRYETPAALALANKDYLVDGISIQLNTMNFTPGTPSALAALIYISGSSIVPYLDDVFSSLFVLLDHYHGYSSLVKSILVVFSALISVVDKSLVRPKQVSQHAVKGEFLNSFSDLLAELDRKPEVDPSILDKKVDLDKLGSERITEVQEDHEGDARDSDDEEEEEEEESDIDDDGNGTPQDIADQATEKWETPIPKSVYITLEKVAGYCDRLMTHESPEIRLAVLSLVTRLTPYLALNSEHYLPLVHKTWPEAISRISDPEVYVVEEGFKCLSAITMHAEDFVSSRIDALWPELARNHAPLFKRPWPQFSSERRTEKALIQFVATIFSSLSSVSMVTTDSVLRVLRPALVRGEFPELLEKLLHECSTSISDLAWLALLEEPCIPEESEKYHAVQPIYHF